MSANGTDRDSGRAIGQVSFAYVWWGASAIFWNELGSVAPIDQLSFRVVTAFFYLMVGATIFGRHLAANGVELSLFNGAGLRSHLTSRHLLYGIGAALSIGANWAVFLWAISIGQSVEAAFGYFLMPIMSVALGVGLLGEKLRRLQVGALALSTVGIVWSVVALGRLPWIAILVAATFAIYGLLRKQGPWDSVSGLTFETGLLAPVAAVALVWRSFAGEGITGDATIATFALIALTGVVTAVPLLAFASASRRVPLSVIGLLQYINPTLQFLVGWQVLGESVSGARLAGFAWVWVALVLIVIDEFGSARRDASKRRVDASKRRVDALKRPVDGGAVSSAQRVVGSREGFAPKEASVRRQR